MHYGDPLMTGASDVSVGISSCRSVAHMDSPEVCATPRMLSARRQPIPYAEMNKQKSRILSNKATAPPPKTARAAPVPAAAPKPGQARGAGYGMAAPMAAPMQPPKARVPRIDDGVETVKVCVMLDWALEAGSCC